MSDLDIDTILQEDRKFPPTPEFSAAAHIDAAKYAEDYACSIADPEAFWVRLATSASTTAMS